MIIMENIVMIIIVILFLVLSYLNIKTRKEIDDLVLKNMIHNSDINLEIFDILKSLELRITILENKKELNSKNILIK